MTEKERKNFNRGFELARESTYEENAKKQAIKDIEIESNKSTISNNKFNKVIGILNLIFVIIGVLLTSILLYLTIKD
jgi:hypothetical protein